MCTDNKSNVWVGYAREGLDIKRSDLTFYNVKDSYFTMYGLSDYKTSFHRMPDEIAASVSGAVYNKNRESSGIRAVFTTDSDCVAIKVKLRSDGDMPNTSHLCQSGFDLYSRDKDGKQKFIKSFAPALDSINDYEGIYELGSAKKRQYILYFPLFNEVLELEIGINSKSRFYSQSCYKIKRPIVFYGSSITQGVGASRSGNCYEGFVSRNIDCDFTNLGFSGNAMGEENMAKYISELWMSAFVFDYDYNAPTVEHLEKTHFPFYQIVRANNKNLPIICVSRPSSTDNEDAFLRRNIILDTYTKARANGDKKIYFADGDCLFQGENRYDCTVDGCHPNDLGYFRMAARLSDIIKRII